ncbi:protein-disulfide reductase DsbD [Bordetella sp. FB-8]|uniref:protein-disulfide reductase DsbD n=1 Tax=Bordetella sp. FB-8 TaxID=1159870 RepID=UPI0003631D7F|nr:protein-disulfide reductase DsbD [Bordetella sp. FB-8]
MKQYGRLALWVLLMALSGWQGATAQSESDFLPPEQAFALQAKMAAPDRLVLHYRVAPGYYLYRERFVLAPAAGQAQWMGAAVYPKGQVKHDPVFDQDMEVYHHDLDIRVPLKPGAAGPWVLTVTSQGCAEAGICYPPMDHAVTLNPVAGGYALAGVDLPQAGGVNIAAAVAGISMPAIRSTGILGASTPAAPGAGIDTPAAPRPPPALGALLHAGDTGLAQALGGLGWLKTAGVFLVLGLLLSFTPCVLPMIPIVSALVLGDAARRSRWRGLGLAAAYVLGMSIVYTALGVAAGLSGAGLAAWLQTPWALAIFALLLALLALAMFDVYVLQMPAQAQAGLSAWANRMPGGRHAGALMMGAVSALIVGPCVAAPLAGALLYISRTGDLLLGGSALFALAWGMGVPLLAVGGSAGALLPRTGPWMESVKRLFGMLLLATAWWMLMPVLPGWTQMLGWAFLAVVSAVMLRAFDALPAEAGVGRMFAKGLGLLLALAGVVWLVGAASGGRDVLQPLSQLSAPARMQATTQGSDVRPPQFTPVHNLAELDAMLRRSDRPVMLDFYADWCVSCREMERDTFSEPSVAARMDRMLLLRADVTRNTAADRALLKRFRLFGPPGMVFFAPGGRELATRVIGYQVAPRFGAALDTVLATR